MKSIRKQDGDYTIIIQDFNFFVSVSVWAYFNEKLSTAHVSLSEKRFTEDFGGDFGLSCFECAVAHLFNYTGIKVDRNGKSI